MLFPIETTRKFFDVRIPVAGWIKSTVLYFVEGTQHESDGYRVTIKRLIGKLYVTEFEPVEGEQKNG